MGYAEQSEDGPRMVREVNNLKEELTRYKSALATCKTQRNNLLEQASEEWALVNAAEPETKAHRLAETILEYDNELGEV
jgi:hypothetical protein